MFKLNKNIFRKLKMEDDDVITGCFICVNGLKFRSPSESEDNENKNGGQNFGTKKSITSNGIHKTIETRNSNNTKVASSRTISFSTTDTSLKPAAATASVKRTCSAPTVIARLKEECNGVGYPDHSCSPPKREISGRISSSIRGKIFQSSIFYLRIKYRSAFVFLFFFLKEKICPETIQSKLDFIP